MRRHIVEMHGNDICHKFLQNNCTARRCFFSHNIMIAQNVRRSAKQSNSQVPTKQDFYELPTVRPAERRQVVAQPIAPDMPLPQMWKIDPVQEAITQAITQQMQKILPQKIAQVKEILQPQNK